MADSINSISLPRLNIPSLFDEPKKRNEIPQNTEKPKDQFRFTVESSMEGFYKNPSLKVNKQEPKAAGNEIKSENWFG